MPMKVPLLDLRAQYATIRDEIRATLDDVCESQHFILGPHVDSFEQRIAEYSQTAHGIGVSSGTDALLVALMALGVAAGDEVITTSYSFFATAGAIARLGARPVFVDIDARSYNLSVDALDRAVTSRTRAILAVHLYGQCADMQAVMAIAAQHNIPVIEDAAQAIGAEFKGRRAGSMGTIGCFSFFPSKNLGGFGDGGMVVTNDADLAGRLRVLRAHGAQPKYHHHFVGGNFRLDAIQAAVLEVKLKHLDYWTRRRQENAGLYERLLVERGLVRDGRLDLPAEVWRTHETAHTHIYNQYVVRAHDRDDLQRFLASAGIGTEVYYPVPLHLQKCFDYLGYRDGSFPEAELASKKTLALPIYPELTDDQMHYIADKIAAFYKARP